jgi:hypothetical protein
MVVTSSEAKFYLFWPGSLTSSIHQLHKYGEFSP